MSDKGPGETEPSTPAGFAAGAAAGLAPAAGAIRQSKDAANRGQLTLSGDGAQAMVKKLHELRARAEELITNAGALDEPLRFGDNWVGEIMNERFRGAVAGSDTSVRSVLRSYRQVLDEVEATVRAAAHGYQTVEDTMTSEFRTLGGTNDDAARRL